MTASQTAPFGMNAQFAWLRRIANLVGKGVLALAIIVLAGLLAVATAFAGLALALFAVMIRLFGSGPEKMHESSNGEGTVTLEARRTPRGWTVE